MDCSWVSQAASQRSPSQRAAINGTPLDARFTNVALVGRELGYEPALFGYTDMSVDPRTVPRDDPRLYSYEGVLPGFDPVCHLPAMDPEPWLQFLRKHGYTWDGEWSKPLALHGTAITHPRAVAWPDGAIDLFVVGQDSAVHSRSRRGGEWQDWTPRGGRAFSPPSIVARDRVVELFVLGVDSAIWHTAVPVD